MKGPPSYCLKSKTGCGAAAAGLVVVSFGPSPAPGDPLRPAPLARSSCHPLAGNINTALLTSCPGDVLSTSVSLSNSSFRTQLNPLRAPGAVPHVSPSDRLCGRHSIALPRHPIPHGSLCHHSLCGSWRLSRSLFNLDREADLT